MFFLLYGAYKLYICADCIVRNSYYPSYVWQETYSVPELDSFEMGGVTLYHSSGHEGAGYEAFPAVEEDEFLFELRGEGLKDGFRRRGEN